MSSTIQCRSCEAPRAPAAESADASPPNRKPLSHAGAMAAASSAGGVVNAAVSQPFVVFKTMQQVAPGGKCPWPTGAQLLRGLPAGLVSSVAKTGVNYTAQDSISRHLREKYPEQKTLVALASGATAGALDTVFTAPIRRVMLLQQLEGEGAWPTACRVYKTDGLGGFYTAAGTVLARNVLASAVFFGVANGLREGHKTALSQAPEREEQASKAAVAARALSEEGIHAFLSVDGLAVVGDFITSNVLLGVVKGAQAAGDEKSSVVAIIAGGAGSVAAALASNPLDVVKTAMQKQVGQKTSALNEASRLLAAEGPRAFMKGASTSVARLVPAGAATYAVTHSIRDALAPYTEESPAKTR